jgi:hypothetical protein
MPIDYKKYPSNWKTEIRPAIMERAKNCCEFCGVKHYAVGNWDGEKFIPTAGNITHDAAGNGELSYKEARELVKHCNECCDDNLIVIVLTIAHLDHDVKNNDFSNLKALCQRCHNRYDVGYRKANRKLNKGVLSLF